MKLMLKQVLKYAPLTLGLAILAVGAVLVPWAKVVPYLARLSWPAVVLLLLGSLAYYLGRVVRYWLMLRLLGQPVAFKKVALACLVAQPVAVLPGGEMYRSAMLKRYGNVSLQDGMPSVVAQSIAESVGLLVIALIGAAVLQRYVAVLLLITTVMASVWAFIRWHNSRTSHRLINKLPGVHVRHAPVRSFLAKNRQLLTGRNFFVMVLASYVSAAAGVLIVYVAAQALGAHLNPLQAVLVWVLPTILEGVSFLPGGLGVNEQGSVGILALFGTTLPLAVAITLITRLSTLGMGFVYGFGALVWARSGGYRHYD